MDRIKVMISSTVKDLSAERDAILTTFGNNPLFELMGATPFIGSSAASSSALKTVELAKECDLYVLVLGSKYGYELDDGRSATEVEFDTAIHQDPTKVLVFLKKSDKKVEAKQKKFIERVSEYYSGYWRIEFEYSHQLQEYVNESVLSWLKDRASINKKVSYCEHFIREALQLKPTTDTEMYYSVREDYVEIEYCAMKESHNIHYSKTEIYSDFWGCLHNVQKDIDRWCQSWKR